MNGIDISQWQGNIRFPLVERAGIELVYIKASEGIDFVDPFFRRHYNGAKDAGLPVGFYHYLTARSASAARQEAYHFVSVTEGLESEGKMALDLEDLTGITKEEINEIALAFLQAVESYSNRSAAIYVDAYNAMLLDEPIAAYALWIAQYGVDEPDMQNNPWESWAGWQYTDMGRVAGIQGNVDRDNFTEEILEENADIVQKTGEPPAMGTTIITYRVRPGDTLDGIARKYHVTPQEIAERNQIYNPNLLYPGELLQIEIRDDRKLSDVYILYQVKPGDTLWGIASRFETTTDALRRVNHIPNISLIYTGQIIKIPRF